MAQARLKGNEELNYSEKVKELHKQVQKLIETESRETQNYLGPETTDWFRKTLEQLRTILQQLSNQNEQKNSDQECAQVTALISKLYTYCPNIYKAAYPKSDSRIIHGIEYATHTIYLLVKNSRDKVNQIDLISAALNDLNMLLKENEILIQNLKNLLPDERLRFHNKAIKPCCMLYSNLRQMNEDKTDIADVEELLLPIIRELRRVKQVSSQVSTLAQTQLRASTQPRLLSQHHSFFKQRYKVSGVILGLLLGLSSGDLFITAVSVALLYKGGAEIDKAVERHQRQGKKKR